MAESCCTPLVTGSGNAPGELRVNVVCGDPINLSFRRCGGWPGDTTATLRLAHPWDWSATIAGTIVGEYLTFHIPPDDARQIPRDAVASIHLEHPGVDPYTWLSGRVHHRGGCC
ncbi:hypothetical protein NDR87_26380 [Nocardia sp. CDC159]|uniref:LtfC/p132/Gp6 beta-sandwich domain-containing protein n=1 Tax=Nocardia pulmonis TaxID=2951408 RepID=A0A9X2E8T7_9NOCA|nr:MULTISPECIES: hypothetical protein [Nocardia]MCM6774975.1 hypothetical protein [Nocardia pulmonis]MCM6789906.1 hypothetical protein [Nocardia sp. CDC159]